MIASVEMPKYQSHKKVWALKIAAVELGESGKAKIAPADPGYAPFETAEGWGSRFKGSDGDLGYYVLYEDGYASWSPTAAFEGGYDRL